MSVLEELYPCIAKAKELNLTSTALTRYLT